MIKYTYILHMYSYIYVYICTRYMNLCMIYNIHTDSVILIKYFCQHNIELHILTRINSFVEFELYIKHIIICVVYNALVSGWFLSDAIFLLWMINMLRWILISAWIHYEAISKPHHMEINIVGIFNGKYDRNSSTSSSTFAYHMNLGINIYSIWNHRWFSWSVLFLV